MYAERREQKFSLIFVHSEAVAGSPAFSAGTTRRHPFVFLIIYDERPTPGALPCRALRQYNRRDRLNSCV